MPAATCCSRGRKARRGTRAGRLRGRHSTAPEGRTASLVTLTACPCGDWCPPTRGPMADSPSCTDRRHADDRGTLTATRLPFGTYHVEVARNGFATFSGLVEIRSALPTEYRVTLSLAP